MHTRAREESGFGLLELLMAMVMLNVGILAIVAAFSSGNAALARASRVSTATALADKQLESYRGLIYDNIVFTTTEWNAAIADSTYTSDTTYVTNMQSPVAPKGLVGAEEMKLLVCPDQPFERASRLDMISLQLRGDRGPWDVRRGRPACRS